MKNIRDGKNKTRPNITIEEIYEYDIDSTPEQLDEYCSKADFVFNLAGVNRPTDPADFKKGNRDFAETLLETLKKHNINFFLDSYGKSSKNIISITQFPFYAVKIDRQMIWSLNSDEKSKIILRETISMIKNLGMDVVAEGIESHEQAIELIKMGCNFLQGFYYSDPLPVPDFMQFIR